MEKDKEFFDILIGAIRRETEAFNYYHQAGEKAPSNETKSLLLQLAEEERRHRVILMQELRNLKRLTSGAQREEFIRKDEISFLLPTEPVFKRAQTLKSVDLAAVSLPSELVGGDFFDTFIIRDQNRMGLFLFDAMGHGFETAELKAKVRVEWGKIKELHLEKETPSLLLSPSSVLARLNQFIWAECHRLACFLSAIYVILDLSNNRLIYSCAGHEPPVQFTNQGYASLSEAGLLLGVDKDAKYPEESKEMYSGDVLMMFSDGVVENLNSKEEEFGRKNLIGAVEKNKNRVAAEIVRWIFTALRDFTGDKPVIDEFTLAIAKIK